MSTEPAIPVPFRTAVRANAVFCGASGLAIAVFSGRLPGLLGAGEAGFYVGLGALLLLYGVHLAFAAGRRSLRCLEGWLIVAGDVAWVAASVAVIAVGVLTPPGVALVLATAAVVGGFAVWQWRALGE